MTTQNCKWKQGDRIDAAALIRILSSKTESLAALAETILCASERTFHGTGFFFSVESSECTSSRWLVLGRTLSRQSSCLLLEVNIECADCCSSLPSVGYAEIFTNSILRGLRGILLTENKVVGLPVWVTIAGNLTVVAQLYEVLDSTLKVI